MEYMENLTGYVENNHIFVSSTITSTKNCTENMV